MKLLLNFQTEYGTWSTEQTICLLIEGFTQEIPQLTIGNVSLMTVDDDFPLRVMRSANFSIPVNSDASTSDYQPRSLTDFATRYRGKVVSVCRVMAQSIRAKQIAEQQTQWVLDMLIFFIASTYPFHPEGDVLISIDGRSPKRSETVLIASGTEVNFHLEGSPKTWTTRLTLYLAQEMQLLGIGELRIVSTKPEDQRTELEDRLLTAVHWLGYSQTQRDPEGEFPAY